MHLTSTLAIQWKVGKLFDNYTFKTHESKFLFHKISNSYACVPGENQASSKKYFTGSLDNFRVQEYEVFQYIPLPPDPLITAKLDTAILNLNEIDLLFRMVGSSNLQLLYRASRDGGDPVFFHNKCDGKGPTISIIKMYRSDYVFGSYLGIPWSSSGNCVHLNLY